MAQQNICFKKETNCIRHNQLELDSSFRVAIASKTLKSHPVLRRSVFIFYSGPQGSMTNFPDNVKFDFKVR